MRYSAGGVAVEGRRFVAQLNVRSESVVQKFRPGRLEIPRRAALTKCFPNEFRSLEFRSAEKQMHHLDFRKSAEERENHRLHRKIRAIGSERVAPRFEIMRHRHMPLARARGRIFVITETHNVRHFLLKIGPIELLFCLRINR